MSKSYRFKCRNVKCGAEFHRYYSTSEFERNQYHTQHGWSCFNCGYPKMAVMKSNKAAKDKFIPGFQRNIMEYCATYKEYQQKLKEKGLIEYGYEDIQPPEDTNGFVTDYWTDDILKEIYDMGVHLSGRTIQALKDGLVEDL